MFGIVVSYRDVAKRHFLRRNICPCACSQIKLHQGTSSARTRSLAVAVGHIKRLAVGREATAVGHIVSAGTIYNRPCCSSVLRAKQVCCTFVEMACYHGGTVQKLDERHFPVVDKCSLRHTLPRLATILRLP